MGLLLSQVVAHVVGPEWPKWMSGALMWPSQGQWSELRPESGRRDGVCFRWLSGQVVCIRPVILGLNPPYFPLWFFSYAITVSNNVTIHVSYLGCLTWWGLPARLETVGFQQTSLYRNYPHPSQVRSAHPDTVCTTTFDSQVPCNLSFLGIKKWVCRTKIKKEV